MQARAEVALGRCSVSDRAQAIEFLLGDDAAPDDELQPFELRAQRRDFAIAIGRATLVLEMHRAQIGAGFVEQLFVLSAKSDQGAITEAHSRPHPRGKSPPR